jgi:sialic acid synthase SpsE/sugar phosphate isomerase/epimerase
MFIEKKIELFTVNKTLLVSKFLDKFNSNNSNFYCIVDKEKKLLGVISLGDIAKNCLSMEAYKSKTVFDIMNTDFNSLKVGVSPSTLIHYLEKYRFVPLVDEFDRIKMLVKGHPNRREFYLGKHSIRNENDYILIAEVGNNHNGSLATAFELIRLAKESGAHVVKFQMRDLDSLYGDTESSQDLSTEYVINLLKKFSLSVKDLYRCFDYCKEIGITPLCTPFDLSSLEHLERYGMDGYKVSSADLTNHELLEAIVKTDKPLIVSTGMSTDEDIDQAISLLEKNYMNYVICHANSTYPAPFSDVNLNYIDNLKARTASVIGYSGHERGWHIPLAAFTKGAQVIEKHFTLDKALEGNDHKVSLLPSEFAKMSQAFSDLSEALGVGYRRQITQGEASNKIALAKSLFCIKDIKKGQEILKENIVIRSPGNGLSPRMKNALIGRVAQRDFFSGDAFFNTDLEDTSVKSELIVPQHYKWCIPVRHRDLYKLYEVFKPPAIEFHLSFKDLDINDEDVITQPLDSEVIVHSPEQFDGDFVLDLFSDDSEVVVKTIDLLNRIFAKSRKLGKLVGYSGKPKVVVNCGGHTANQFLSQFEIDRRIDNFVENVEQVNTNGCRFLAQTMPPYPWHFGGQSFHNQFTSAENIIKILQSTVRDIELCLDISHSYMWCNFSGENLFKFIQQVAPNVSHIHISDADGVSEEGMQVGKGTLDFLEVKQALLSVSKDATLLPEIWQGHDNLGEGFRIALDRLNKLGY